MNETTVYKANARWSVQTGSAHHMNCCGYRQFAFCVQSW